MCDTWLNYPVGYTNKKNFLPWGFLRNETVILTHKHFRMKVNTQAWLQGKILNTSSHFFYSIKPKVNCTLAAQSGSK